MSTIVTNPSQTFLLLENPKKSNNLGPILRCAAAYGISTVLAVGFSKCSVDGSHGASKHVDIVAFPTVDQAIASLGNDRGALSLIGILGGLPMSLASPQNAIYQVHEDKQSGLFQIDHVTCVENDGKKQPSSYPVGSWPFEDGKIHCFAICKSTRGLTSSLARHCDKFIHIPHKSLKNSDEDFHEPSLLDVPSCLSVCLHHFLEWAGQAERKFQGHKFELVRPSERAIEQTATRRNERVEQRKRLMEEMASEEAETNVSVFFSEKKGDY